MSTTPIAGAEHMCYELGARTTRAVTAAGYGIVAYFDTDDDARRYAAFLRSVGYAPGVLPIGNPDLSH